jgi:hypothetical protein
MPPKRRVRYVVGGHAFAGMSCGARDLSVARSVFGTRPGSNSKPRPLHQLVKVPLPNEARRAYPTLPALSRARTSRVSLRLRSPSGTPQVYHRTISYVKWLAAGPSRSVAPLTPWQRDRAGTTYYHVRHTMSSAWSPPECCRRGNRPYLTALAVGTEAYRIGITMSSRNHRCGLTLPQPLRRHAPSRWPQRVPARSGPLLLASHPRRASFSL